MKTELTQEGKARFFASNLYCDAIFEDIPHKIGSINLRNSEIDLGYWREVSISDCKLIKTPLSKITDEDAIEVGRLLGYDKEDFSDGVDSVLRIIKNWITNLIKGNTKQYTSSVIIAYQYLQSKSYVSSYYCPIANRIVTVEEQIEAGWITLRN